MGLASARNCAETVPGSTDEREFPVNRTTAILIGVIVLLVGTVAFLIGQRSDEEPAAIAPHEINGIRRLVDTDLLYDPCPLIREGMMVEVVHGPLRGVVGRLVRKGAHARLVLSVDLIGQVVSVEVDAADVKAY